MVKWDDIAFDMPGALTKDVRAAWSWLLPKHWEPILCSKIGGIFLSSAGGEVLRLDTAVGLVDAVGQNVEQFHDVCRTNAELVHEWFGTGLIERLHEAGKIAGPGECYGFTFLPIFAEGKYEPDNMFVAPIREVLICTADIHKQMSDLPNGSKVQVKIVD